MSRTLHTRRLEALGDDRVADLAAVLPGVSRDVGADRARFAARRSASATTAR